MFDTILMRPNSSAVYPTDFGQMIENLLFYKKTIVHLSRQSVPKLFDLADIDVLEELFKSKSLSIYYNNSHTGFAKMGELYSVDSYGLSNLDLEKELYEESFRYKGDAQKSKKFSQKLSRLIKEYQLPQNFNETLNQQLKDDEFRKEVVVESFLHLAPEQKLNVTEIEYNVDFVNRNQFKLETNIKIENPEKIALDSPILFLVNACENLKVMSEYSSEISLPEFNSKMVRLKTNSLLAKSIHSKNQIEVFNHFAFDESWALREAINQKQLHVKAVLDVIRKAAKFKDWLENLPDDTNLMREYVKKIQEKSPLEKLPAKSIRFYLTTGVGVILGATNPVVGIPISAGLSAFDSFLLDKLGHHWTPNQFIENELRPLVKQVNSH